MLPRTMRLRCGDRIAALTTLAKEVFFAKPGIFSAPERGLLSFAKRK
jgi:hypothetical protein